MTKILALVLSILSALGSSQLAIRQEGEQQVPGMPGAGDIARCTATGDCPVSLSTSSCLGKIDPQCAEELCGMEDLAQCVACATSTGSFGSWSAAAIQMLCPDADLSNVTSTNGTAVNGTAVNGTDAGNATAAGNGTDTNATAAGNATGNVTNATEGGGNATAAGNGTGNGTGAGNGTAPAGGDAGAVQLIPAVVLGMTLLAGAFLV